MGTTWSMTIQQWNKDLSRRTLGALVAVAGVGTFGAIGGTPASSAAAAPSKSSSSLTVDQVLLGLSLHHTFMPADGTTSQSETLSIPDDITQLGDHIFVGFKSRVGPRDGPVPTATPPARSWR